ncbi:MAG TPA: hypothetical protein VFX33_01850 [Actinomycetales bacterium]|nr:hypothetical protein [Actinomycetales bacterium]
MGGDAPRRHWADDGELADEIELYGDLVVAASESDEELSQRQIDLVLGVDPEPATPSSPNGVDAGTGEVAAST